MTKLTNYKCELVAESFVDDKESPRWVLHVVPDQIRCRLRYMVYFGSQNQPYQPTIHSYSSPL